MGPYSAMLTGYAPASVRGKPVEVAMTRKPVVVAGNRTK